MTPSTPPVPPNPAPANPAPANPAPANPAPANPAPANPYPPPPAWAREIASVGVTGTNGKSSTVRYVAAALAADPRAPGPGLVARVTTVDAGILDPRGDLEVAPPPATHGEFLALMARLHRSGGRRAAIEATSATLGLGFARAWPFVTAVFTNLGHDHLRTHGSFEHYLASKAQLFLALPPGGAAILNAADPNAGLIAEILPPGVRALWFAGPGRARDRAVDLRIGAADHDWSGLRVTLETAQPWALPPQLTLRSLAAVQAENVAAALLAAIATGAPADRAAEAIAACDPPPGRFEPVPGSSDGPRVIIDYAHGPEALREALASARALCSGTLFLVFGAGGDADPSKRGPLGAAAAGADRVWLTSDNPRREDPAAIAAAVRAGLPPTHPCAIELDRGAAISRAIAEAGRGDLVLIAGKGHESVQEVGDRRLPFSDRAVAAAALTARERPSE